MFNAHHNQFATHSQSATHVLVVSADYGKVMFGELVEGKGCSGGQREGLGGAPGETCYGIWHEVGRVAKGCTKEGRQMVSTGRGGGGGIHAEMIQCGEL